MAMTAWLGAMGVSRTGALKLAKLCSVLSGLAIPTAAAVAAPRQNVVGAAAASVLIKPSPAVVG